MMAKLFLLISGHVVVFPAMNDTYFFQKNTIPDGSSDAAHGPVVVRSLVRADFDAMARLEARFYGEEFITPAEESYAWYVRHLHSVVAARTPCGCGIAGFVNLFPVRPGVGEALLAGRFNDAGLVADDIVPLEGLRASGARGNKTTMFLSCVVIDPKFRGRGLLRRLMGRAVEVYRPYMASLGHVVADTVTPDGARLMERYGFMFQRPSDHGSRIYAQPFDVFANHVAEVASLL